MRRFISSISKQGGESLPQKGRYTMTANERALQSVNNEIEKLLVRKERCEKALEKKIENAEKLNINVTADEWFKIRDNVTDKQFAAYFELSIARGNLKEVLKKIENANKRKEKAETKVTEIKHKTAEEEIERQKAETIEEWAKDGITVTEITSRYIIGITPSGKRFSIYSNNGFTDRSRHCYTMRIDGETIFTSGEFYRAYRTVKNS